MSRSEGMAVRRCPDRARVAGGDEAGRGPLAGPVVAAAVILHARRRIRGRADSKVLSAEERARLAPIIRARALAWAIGWADRDEIDCLNILEATLLAMRRALLALPVCPTHVRVDGNRCPWLARSEERRVGEEGRSRWAPDHLKKKKNLYYTCVH